MTERFRMIPVFQYAAQFLEAIDGDTVKLQIDQGLYNFAIRHVRILGINCPEMKGPTKADGIRAKEATEWWFANHSKIVIATKPDPRQQTDDFGRWLAFVWGDNAVGEQEELGKYLLETNNAVVYWPKGTKNANQ